MASLRLTALVPCLLGISSLAALGCAAGGVPPDSDSEDGGGGSGGFVGGGGSFVGTGASTSTSTSTSSGGGGTPNPTGTDGPFGSYAPGDDPPFKTGAELCAYINEERMGYASHDRFRGQPWTGEYHQNVTWPYELTVDPDVRAAAQADANALAAGAGPTGAPFSDGSPPPHQYLYVSGVDSDAYAVATNEGPGDWTTDLAGNLTAGITSNNGTTRMALFYHDPGGVGPVLTRIGCAGAAAAGGGRWWVVRMAP